MNVNVYKPCSRNLEVNDLRKPGLFEIYSMKVNNRTRTPFALQRSYIEIEGKYYKIMNTVTDLNGNTKILVGYESI